MGGGCACGGREGVRGCDDDLVPVTLGLPPSLPPSLASHHQVTQVRENRTEELRAKASERASTC